MGGLQGGGVVVKTFDPSPYFSGSELVATTRSIPLDPGEETFLAEASKPVKEQEEDPKEGPALTSTTV
uniref:Uncharacterized protein n=1 Tax=Sphaerodactylus townsendi TaxID=933632 RepID=A0ACB8ECE6_9SAUR